MTIDNIMSNTEKAVTWLQIQNWWPIMVAIVAVAIYMSSGFATIDKRQALIEQKLDTLISMQSQINNIEGRIGDHEIRLTKLETRHIK